MEHCRREFIRHALKSQNGFGYKWSDFNSHEIFDESFINRIFDSFDGITEKTLNERRRSRFLASYYVHVRDFEKVRENIPIHGSSLLFEIVKRSMPLDNTMIDMFGDHIWLVSVHSRLSVDNILYLYDRGIRDFHPRALAFGLPNITVTWGVDMTRDEFLMMINGGYVNDEISLRFSQVAGLTMNDFRRTKDRVKWVIDMHPIDGKITIDDYAPRYLPDAEVNIAFIFLLVSIDYIQYLIDHGTAENLAKQMMRKNSHCFEANKKIMPVRVLTSQSARLLKSAVPAIYHEHIDNFTEIQYPLERYPTQISNEFEEAYAMNFSWYSKADVRAADVFALIIMYCDDYIAMRDDYIAIQ